VKVRIGAKGPVSGKAFLNFQQGPKVKYFAMRIGRNHKNNFFFSWYLVTSLHERLFYLNRVGLSISQLLSTVVMSSLAKIFYRNSIIYLNINIHKFI